MNNGVLEAESKQFGTFLLEWDTNMDGFHWTLRERKAAEGTGYEGDFQSPMRKALT